MKGPRLSPSGLGEERSLGEAPNQGEEVPRARLGLALKAARGLLCGREDVLPRGLGRA